VEVHVSGKYPVSWVEGEGMHRKCGRERVGNRIQMDVRQAAGLNGHCSELADRSFLMLEQRFPTCVPRIPTDPRPVPRG